MSAPKKHIFVSDSKPHCHHGDTVNNRTGLRLWSILCSSSTNMCYAKSLALFWQGTRDIAGFLCLQFEHSSLFTLHSITVWPFTRTYQRQRLREQLYGFSCKSLVTLKAMSIVSTDSSEVHSVCACVYSSVWKRAAWCYSKIEIVKIHPGWLFETLFPLLRVDPLTRWSAGRFLPR